ncbi:MAG: uncultured phage MedDCM-OCT-S38-C3 [Cyanobacteriota bacterium]|jgi:hypothetical protein
MNCPHCNHDKSRVTETRSAGEADRRIRLCQGCGRTFQTLERVCVYAGRAAGYIEASPPPILEVVPDPEPAPVRARATARHEASPEEQCLSFVSPEARLLLVQWWNESRKSKHRANATWTRAAWEASVQRVANLPTDLQLTLCRAGVEHGWQALKLDYIKDELAKPTAAGRPMPKDPSMRAALESWPKPA